MNECSSLGKGGRMNRRSYRDESDIDLLMSFNAEAIKETGGCGYLHPGDIPHHFFSGNKLYDPTDLATIWEDGNGVAAWTLAGPSHLSSDVQVRPDMRGGDFERAVIEHSEAQLREQMSRYDVKADRIEAGACRCDVDRVRLLLELGWIEGTKAEYVLNRRSLDRIPDADLPKGFCARPAHGLEEADALADLHMAAFSGTSWTGTLYKRYMQSPGYSSDREYVVESPDGSLAAFTVTWRDEINRTGLFEPVGTHPDYRRKGLGRGLLCWAMQRMAAGGLLYAIVQNGAGNAASRGLYAACGFKPWQFEDSYYKPFKS